MTIYLRMGPLMSGPVEVPPGTTEYRLRIPCVLTWATCNTPATVSEQVERQALFMPRKQFHLPEEASLAYIFDWVG